MARDIVTVEKGSEMRAFRIHAARQPCTLPLERQGRQP